MRRVALTTLDNPWDPFDNYPEWYQFDTSHGYGTSSYLARIVGPVYELGESESLRALEEAIDEILEFNLLGIYKKVVREDSVAEV